MIALEYDRNLSPENRQRLIALGWTDDEIREFGCNDSQVLHTSPVVSRTANFHTPIEMHSIAMHSRDELEDFRRKAPDVQVVDGVPIAKNRHQKLQALKAAGYTERN